MGATLVIAMIGNIKAIGKDTTKITKIVESINLVLGVYACFLSIIELFELITETDGEATNFFEDNFSFNTILGFMGIIFGAIGVGLDDDAGKIFTVLAVVIIFYIQFLSLIAEI